MPRQWQTVQQHKHKQHKQHKHWLTWLPHKRHQQEVLQDWWYSHYHQHWQQMPS
jgi:hypothetical protein